MTGIDPVVSSLMARLRTPAEKPEPRCPAVYAYTDPSILAKLQAGGLRSAKEYIERFDEKFRQDLLRFESTSVAATFNPHRPLQDAAYYVRTDTFKDLNVLLPFEGGGIRATHVVHTGDKGSGKTSVQNQWLKVNHDVLEEKRIFYVRCDATKIFGFWMRRLASPDMYPVDTLPTVEDYLDLQMLYIIAKWQEFGLNRTLLAEMEQAKLTFPFKEARAVDASARAVKEVVWYVTGHVADSIRNYEAGDSKKSYLVDALFMDKPTKRREYFRWKECAQAIKAWMRGNGVTLLRILDGVDNLHLNTREGRAVYSEFLPQVVEFILRKGSENEIRYAVMRKRTWIDVQRHDPITSGESIITSPHTIVQTPPPFFEVGRRRLEWLKDGDESMDAARFIEAAINALPDADKLHNNLRTMIAAAASLAEQTRFRYFQLNTRIDIGHQAGVQMKRNLFLRGRFYLETAHDFYSMNRQRGLPYLNQFWFSEEFSTANGARDPLFIRVRLLELLQTGDLLESDLLHYMTEGFGYTMACAERALLDARAFSWVDSKSCGTDSRQVIYEISEAGRYLLNDLLADIDVLYVLALDTRLPRSFFDRGLIQVHTNHMYERSGYIGAAVVTVFTFLWWLADRMHEELSDIDMAVFNGKYQRTFLSDKSIAQIESRLKDLLHQASSEDRDMIAAHLVPAMHAEPC